MKIRSLELLTKVRCQLPDSVVSDTGDCIAIRTPSNPTYWEGNCLAFRSPPKPGDYALWMEHFHRELGLPEERHRFFMIDSPEGEPGASDEFVANGFTVGCHDVLTLCSSDFRPHPPGSDACLIRRIASEADWQALLALSLETGTRDGGPGTSSGFHEFLKRKFASYRRMADGGAGSWWGVFQDERLVADMGLFFADGLGRFCDVETHPDFRRRGLCRRLLTAACSDAFAQRRAETLVIMPEDGAVRRIYESVGFRMTEHSVSFLRTPLIKD